MMQMNATCQTLFGPIWQVVFQYLYLALCDYMLMNNEIMGMRINYDQLTIRLIIGTFP